MGGKTAYKKMSSWNPFVRDAIGVVAAALYIIVLVSVNLIGYAIGAGSFAQVVGKFTTPEAWKALMCAFYFLCVGVCIMNYIKQNVHGSSAKLPNDNKIS